MLARDQNKKRKRNVTDYINTIHTDMNINCPISLFTSRSLKDHQLIGFPRVGVQRLVSYRESDHRIEVDCAIPIVRST